MSNDLRKDNNRIQMQLVRLLQHAQTWHDMEQIADAMTTVDIRANSMLREAEHFDMTAYEAPSKALGTYMDVLEAIRREHNGVFGIRLFYGHDGHNACSFDNYEFEICRGESGRSIDEAVSRCIQTWNMQREQQAVIVREHSGMQTARDVLANYGPACAEQTTIHCGGQPVRIVCGAPQSAHTPEAAKADVGMDHNFVPGTWNA